MDEAFLEMTKALIKKNNGMSTEEKKKQVQSGKIGGHKGLASLNKKEEAKTSNCC